VILVTGATGFLGRHVVHALRDQEHTVRCLVRSEKRARMLAASGCAIEIGDMADPASLRRACDGIGAIIHLAAIIRGRPRDFREVMIDGTRALIEAAATAHVSRFVLVSALGLNERSRELTPYYEAKWEQERMLKGSGLSHVIVRPSFVFDGSGGVLPTFIRLVRFLPVVPVLGPGVQRIQPISATDVAAHLVKATDLDDARDRTFDLAGREQPTWDELYLLIARLLGKRRLLVHVPFALARLQAALFERLPGFPFTRDQLKMLAAGDNTGDIESTLEAFGLPLRPLEEQIRQALA